MKIGEKDARLKLCLLTFSSNQEGFDKMYPKVGPPDEQLHEMKPYDEQEMAEMLGVAADEKFKWLYVVLGGIPRRWFEPDGGGSSC